MRESKVVKRSVFRKFVMVFLAMILPVSTAAIAMYSWQISSFDKAAFSNYESIIHGNCSNVKDELEKVQGLALDFLNDENIGMLTGMESIINNYQKTTAVNRLFYSLKLLKNNSKYIHRIQIYLTDMKRVIDSDNNIDVYNPTEKIEGITKYSKNVFSMENDKIYTAFLPAGSSFHRENFRFAIVVEYEKKEILRDLVKSLPDSALNIINHQKKAIMDVPSNKVTITEKDMPEFSAMNSSHKQRINGEPVWNYTVYAENPELNLIFTIPLENINPQSKTLQGYFIAFIFVFICSTIIVTQLSQLKSLNKA